MSDKKSTETHEVYTKPGKALGPAPFWIGIVLVVSLIGGAVYFYPKVETPEKTVITVVTWYADASIDGMTFGSFLGVSDEDKFAAAALFLSTTLWKDRLDPNSSHEELRPYAHKLSNQTMLLVVSNISMDASITEVFQGIISKPEKAMDLIPPAQQKTPPQQQEKYPSTFRLEAN